MTAVSPNLPPCLVKMESYRCAVEREGRPSWAELHALAQAQVQARGMHTIILPG